MDRTFTERQNEIIVEKAIRYTPRGIVGIDIAGPRPNADGPYPYRNLRPLVQQAREAGLGVTIHVGEEGGEYGIAEIREVVSTLRPDRIGHGILAARDTKLMTHSRAGDRKTGAKASCPEGKASRLRAEPLRITMRVDGDRFRRSRSA
jgi:adenosine deaminase